MREYARRKRMANDEKTIAWAKKYKESANAVAKEQTNKVLNRCKKQKMDVVSKDCKRFVDTGWRLVYQYSSVPILTLRDGGTKYKVTTQ